MYWIEVRPSEHFELYHKDVMAWSDVVRIIYQIKKKRRKGDRILIQDDRFYILCELKDDILYVINVKVKK